MYVCLMVLIVISSLGTSCYILRLMMNFPPSDTFNLMNPSYVRRTTKSQSRTLVRSTSPFSQEHGLMIRSVSVEHE